MLKQFGLLASYNQWMNERIYASAAKLSPEERWTDRGAFFGSILGTLNHVVVGDRIWLRRFANQLEQNRVLDPVVKLAAPTALNQILYRDFEALTEHRRMLDRIIIDWVNSLAETDLEQVLRYSTTQGAPGAKSFADVVLHFFNHQTHHRGQVSTLLFQAGVDVGATDLLLLIPNEST